MKTTLGGMGAFLSQEIWHQFIEFDLVCYSWRNSFPSNVNSLSQHTEKRMTAHLTKILRLIIIGVHSDSMLHSFFQLAKP